jgi:hypothetical protein
MDPSDFKIKTNLDVQAQPLQMIMCVAPCYYQTGGHTDIIQELDILLGGLHIPVSSCIAKKHVHAVVQRASLTITELVI